MFTKTTESLLNNQVPVEIVFTETKTQSCIRIQTFVKTVCWCQVPLYFAFCFPLLWQKVWHQMICVSARDSTFGFKHKIKLARFTKPRRKCGRNRCQDRHKDKNIQRNNTRMAITHLAQAFGQWNDRRTKPFPTDNFFCSTEQPCFTLPMSNSSDTYTQMWEHVGRSVGMQLNLHSFSWTG